MRQQPKIPERCYSVSKHSWVLPVLVGILLVAALLRGLYLHELMESPDFVNPSIDAAYHDYWAWSLASGDWTVPELFDNPYLQIRPYFRPPGYPYFLAAVYFVFGHGYLSPRIVQMGIGLFSSLLGFFFARKWFGPLMGVIFAAFMSFYWIFIYFEGELLGTAITVLLTVLLLGVVSLWVERVGFMRGFVSGVVLGVYALFRPNVLLFGPVAVVWLVWRCRRKRKWDHFISHSTGFLLAILLSVTPTALRNYLVSGDLTFISAQGGMSLLIGNNRQADGVNHYLPGFGFVSSPYDYPRAVHKLERSLGLAPGAMGYSRASEYYTRQALRFIIHHPLRFLALTARKAALFWGKDEVTNNKEISFCRQRSPVLSALPGNFAGCVSLFLLGVIMLWFERSSGRKTKKAVSVLLFQQREVLILVLLFVAAYFLSVLPFVSAARYRVPVIPGMLLLAAGAVRRLINYGVRRQYWRLAAGVGIGTGLFFLASLNLSGYESSPAKWHYDRGIAYSAQGDLPRASEEYHRALEIKVDYVQAYNNLGVLLLREGKVEEAIFLYQKVIALQPDRAEAYSNLGDALSRLGRQEEALSCFDQALRLDPECVQAYNNLGIALHARGEFGPAVENYRKALEIKSDYEEAHYNLALSLGAQGKLEEAIGHYRQALQINPRSADAHNNLGNTLVRRGELAEAIRHFSEALKLSPQLINARNNLANVLARQGKFEEALGHYQKILEIDPDNAEAHFNLGVTLALEGKASRAVEHYRRALEIMPRHTRAHYNLGLILSGEGRLAEALEHFESALRLQPDFQPARKALYSARRRLEGSQ